MVMMSRAASSGSLSRLGERPHSRLRPIAGPSGLLPTLMGLERRPERTAIENVLSVVLGKYSTQYCVETQESFNPHIAGVGSVFVSRKGLIFAAPENEDTPARHWT